MSLISRIVFPLARYFRFHVAKYIINNINNINHISAVVYYLRRITNQKVIYVLVSWFLDQFFTNLIGIWTTLFF